MHADDFSARKNPGADDQPLFNGFSHGDINIVCGASVSDRGNAGANGVAHLNRRPNGAQLILNQAFMVGIRHAVHIQMDMGVNQAGDDEFAIQVIYDGIRRLFDLGLFAGCHDLFVFPDKDRVFNGPARSIDQGHALQNRMHQVFLLIYEV